MKRRVVPSNVGDYLKYDPSSGAITYKARTLHSFSHLSEWKARNECGRWNTRYAGKSAGSPCKEGYLRVTLLNRRYLAHVLAWVLFSGAMPGDDVDIDHINLNKCDNRWSNLRLATRAENLRNVGKQTNNSSGFKGVCWHTQKQRWQALIAVDGRNKYLGLFDTPEAAHAAYCVAAEKLHGEFARVR